MINKTVQTYAVTGVGLTGDSKLAIGANVSVNGFVISVLALWDWQPAQGVHPASHPMAAG